MAGITYRGLFPSTGDPFATVGLRVSESQIAFDVS